MPRSRKTDSTQPSHKDPASNIMSALLPIHSAITLDWLADAAATAARRTHAFTFVYFEDQDGRLDRKAPASDPPPLQQRAIDGFGRTSCAPASTRRRPAIAEALDAHADRPRPPSFPGLVAPDKAERRKGTGIASAASCRWSRPASASARCC
jgi:hypothetical protein